ncbi:RNA-binding cell elongation regulator Jag/EloR [Alkalibacterium kapii]|uniref:RNA-binding protein KhpB n=1 Tax=Alkalibacterium kapii TaxID=426704 RepID=A0A511ARJ6_9LACT|nr:RNA-binding cell elongation regulator Jag/EloR [Alkalibacterium kapii]GEK90829.1 RNA-binding protein Jag [Alkalibacterium kapii]
MNDKYTAQAATTEAAIEKGLKALGINKEDAIIEVVQESKKGFIGIGQKDAIVVVKKTNTKDAVEELLSKEVMLGEEESTTIKPSEKQEEKGILEDEADTETDKEMRETGNETNETVEDKKASNVKDASETVETEKAEDTNNVSQEKKELFNEQDEAAVQKVSEYLKTVATKMGVEDVTINVKRDYNRVKFSIETKDAGLIIGRHGKVLNSLQTLAQIQMHQEADNKLYAKVDAENYRDRRKKTVEQLATRTAEKVQRTKRPVILEPMPAHERKQIHRYLNRFSGVQTHSEGKDPHRYLVVEPSKEEDFTL